MCQEDIEIARTMAVLAQGSRVTDYISLGVITRALPPEKVNSTLDHPDIGPHRYDGINFTMSRTPGELRTAAPRLGEHTEWLCTRILGMTDAEFVQLLEEGVFR